MTERILGPEGSQRRRRFLWVPLLTMAALALFFIGGAQAVHDVGVFQLDGNAQTSVQSSPPAAEDWDLICKANPVTALRPDGCTFATGYSVPSGTTTATASSFVTDGVGASIFTGGGSKDPQDVSSWKWKDGSVPDKDNLQHAFAARYSIPKTTACPAPATATNCDLIYFGSDRFDNSGDAQQGFWFFQNQVVLAADGTFQDGLGNPATHTNGDLLIVSDFSNGGTTSTINVYKWLNGGLSFLAGGDNQLCAPALTNDAFCGIVNPAATPLTVAPWTFTDKSGNHNYLNGELYEAGINLSDPSINLGGECFSSFAAETRSSTSTTATLKDFILGQFAQCHAVLGTTPSSTSVSPGTAVHDTATITGNQPTKHPSGTVTFSLCTYAVGSTATTCPAASAVGIGTGTLAATANDGESTAVSPDVNCAAPGTGCSATAGVNPLAPGHYCFRATWPGDTNYRDALTEDGSTSQECFDVVVIPTSMTTSQFFYPNDSATVSTGTGNLPAGNVVFKLYSGSSLAVAQTNCTNNTATGLLYTSTPQAITGNTSNSQTVSSNNITSAVPTDTSNLYWRVTYTISPANPAYSASSSTCVENATYSHTAGSAATATFNNDPN